MSVRVTCPACDATMTVNDDKRGGKVRCKSCEKAIAVPADTNGKKKRDEDETIQDSRNVKAKAGAANKKKKADDDEEERPSKKKKAKKGAPVLLIAGGLAGLFLLLLVAAAAVGGYWLLRPKPSEINTPVPEQQARGAPKTDIEAKKAPEKKPEAKKEPEPKKDPVPEALPAELQKVKQATVFVSVSLPDKTRSEGSGFLAVEPGLVITNAHVLGMMAPNAPPPNFVDVTWNVGEPNETKKRAQIVAVDPVNDLAALRLDAPDLPMPLTFEDPSKLSPSQKVHIAGFPFVKKVSKTFQFNPTEIARLKKDGAGGLEEIHVQEGMNRGNSGGPVVTPGGMVVGVGTGAVRDPLIHAAIPTETVKRFLDARIGDGVFDKAMMQGGQTKVPVTFPLTDPLGKIKDVRMEVWTGVDGPPRPYAYKQPTPEKTDGPHAPQPLTNKKTSATGNIVVPAVIPTGQKVWVQAIITCSDNTMQWGVATTISLPPASPYQLVPANLTVNLTTPKQRTMKLKYTLTKKSTVTTSADILEDLGTDANGPLMRTGYGTLTISTDGTAQTKQILDLVRQIPTNYSLDKTGLVRSPRMFKQPDKSVVSPLKDQVLDQQLQIGTAFEAMTIPMPNKTVQPNDSWQTNYPVWVRTKKGGEIQLALTLTYLGMLKTDDRNEAVITVTGKVSAANNPDLKKWEGDVSGKLGFDTSGGYLSSGKLKLSADGDAGYTLDLDMKRIAGGSGIQLPQDKTAPPDPIAKFKWDKKDNLTTADPGDPQFSDPNPKKKKIAHMKSYMVNLDAGKNYAVSLTTNGFEGYLKVWAPNNTVVAFNGPGANAKIASFRPPMGGPFRISVISPTGKTGGFHVTVTEIP